MQGSLAARLVATLAVAFGVPADGQDDNGSAAAEVICESIMMPMRDEVALFSQIYRPEASGRYPVVVIRTPYAGVFGDGCFANNPWDQEAAQLAEQGYVSILQQSRGTRRSEGEFVPFLVEQNDGHDAVQWAAEQPWSNGKVGMTSSSYLGATQWQAALTSPANLLVITPGVTASNYHDDWVARNGVFDLLFSQVWAFTLLPDALSRKMNADGVSQEAIDAALQVVQRQLVANRYWFGELPLSGPWMDTKVSGTDYTIRELIPFLAEWYEHPSYDAYWQAIDVRRQIDGVKVPALVSGGWYDLFAKGTIESYLAIRRAGGTAAAREETKLVMDCCGHANGSQSAPDQINWGPRRIDPTLNQRFLDFYLKGEEGALTGVPRVQLSVLLPPDNGLQGDNFVLYADDYPIRDTTPMRLHLRSNGSANTRLGDGSLSGSGPGGVPDRFTYDPADPVPTVGGIDAVSLNVGDGRVAVDQSSVEMRQDVLVYTGDSLQAAHAVIGAVKVNLWAATTAVDTDFTAKLVDVHPDGVAHNVVERVVRARYRNGPASEAPPLVPGQAYQFGIDLGHVATVFKAGHRIRLEISSSSFPFIARNLNTGLSNETTGQVKLAEQTILHDAMHPSYIELPIVALSAACWEQARATGVATCLVD
jgi:hypothetical protein